MQRAVRFAILAILSVSSLGGHASAETPEPASETVAEATAAALVAPSPEVEAQAAPAVEEPEPKVLKPPKPGTKKFINIQIDPEEQARRLAALPKWPGSDKRGVEGVPPGLGEDPFGAFWALVSPKLADANPGRLDSTLMALEAVDAVRWPRLDDLRSITDRFGRDILRETVGTRVSPALVAAIISVESAGRIDAVSHAGASGLMQLMPATAERFGVTDRTAPAQSIKGGVAYLDWLMKEFGNDPVMILASYNAGEGAVRDYGGVPPYRETRAYVPKVLAAFRIASGLCRTPPQLISDGCVFVGIDS